MTTIHNTTEHNTHNTTMHATNTIQQQCNTTQHNDHTTLHNRTQHNTCNNTTTTIHNTTQNYNGCWLEKAVNGLLAQKHHVTQYTTTQQLYNTCVVL